MPPRRFPNLTQEQRDELAVSFVACKGPIRHRWDVVPASPDERPQYGTLMLLRCDNCGTYRRDLFSRITGDLIPGGRSYQHPPGYRDAGRNAADERMTSRAWRALFAEVVMEREPDLLVDSEDTKPTRTAATKRDAKVVALKRRRRTS